MKKKKVKLNFEHGTYSNALSKLDNFIFFSPLENSHHFTHLNGGSAPPNLRFVDDPPYDIIIQGQDADIQITHNLGTRSIKNWTVYTTELKLALTPPRGKWLLIRHGIDTNEFYGWRGNMDAPVVTHSNKILTRPHAFRQEDYEAIAQNFDFRVLGRNNKDGFVSQKDLVEILRDSSVYVNLSRTINPFSLLEAMSVGIPIVTVRSYTITDIITHGRNGFIAWNTEELVKFTNYLLAERSIARKMGKYARETIIKRYNLKDFLEKWNWLLSQLPHPDGRGLRHQKVR